MDSDALSQTYHLMGLCARAWPHPRFEAALESALERFAAWETLPAQAERHGMGPLLWHHLRERNLPPAVRRILQGLYLRDRALNQIHAATLCCLLETLERQGIRPLVLKGLALAWQAYPDPALRPVSDIDLLLQREEVRPAIQALQQAGYRFDPFPTRLPKGISAYAPTRQDVSTHIELHHYDPAHRQEGENTPDDEFCGLQETPQRLVIAGCPVFTPSPHDTLLYLMRHLVRHLFDARADRPIAFKWMADIVNLVETQAETLDWQALHERDPFFGKRLAVLYSLTPPPPELAARLGWGAPALMGQLGQYPQGWPQWPFPNWRKVGLGRYLWRTFSPPPEWWLRLVYGIPSGSTAWHGAVVYRARLLRRMTWAALRRLSPFS